MRSQKVFKEKNEFPTINGNIKKMDVQGLGKPAQVGDGWMIRARELGRAKDTTPPHTHTH
jgi:hypothetical protein